MEKTLKIGRIQAKVGTKNFGFLKIGQTPSSDVVMPIMVVNGTQAGSKLALIAGIHGCEYSGIEAVIRVVNSTNPEELRGTIIAVPVANTPAFESRTAYVCPIDGINLNRVFPGDPNGSMSRRIAHVLFQEIVKKADCLVDLHGADLHEELPSSGLILMKNVEDERVNQVSQDLADLFDAGYILESTTEGTCIGQACGIGIPAIAPEAGGMAARIDEDSVAFYVNGILNVMKYLKMIEGLPETKKTKKKRIVDLHSVRATTGGVFYPKIEAGTEISQGDLIGEIKDLKGRVVQKIEASISGVIFIRMTNVVINSGDVILILGKMET